MAHAEPPVTDWEESGSSDPAVAIDPNISTRPPVPPKAPPVDASQNGNNGAATIEPPADDETLDETRDDRGRYRGRHRARSQQAGQEDAPRIAELTKKYRDLETKFKTLEAERAAPPKTTPPPSAPPVLTSPNVPGFTEAEPTLEQFAASDDPYRDYMRALGRYDRRKDAFEADQARLTAQRDTAGKTHQAQLQAWYQERDREHVTRLDAYIAANPSARQELTALGEEPISPVMYAALQLHERGPEMMHQLAKQPALLDELFLLTEGKPVGDPYRNPLVAKTQRRILAGMQAAPSNGHTGSVAQPAPESPSPRPPNPVRTAPHAPSTDRPADDDDLVAHEHFHYPDGPRGRFRR